MKSRKIPIEAAVSGLIAAGIIALVVTAVVHVSCGVTGIDHDAAESGARQYAKDLGLKLKGISCARVDTDGDGYVSCSLSIEDPNGGSHIEAVECAASFSMNSGCRVPKMRANNRQ